MIRKGLISYAPTPLHFLGGQAKKIEEKANKNAEHPKFALHMMAKNDELYEKEVL